MYGRKQYKSAYHVHLKRNAIAGGFYCFLFLLLTWQSEAVCFNMCVYIFLYTCILVIIKSGFFRFVRFVRERNMRVFFSKFFSRNERVVRKLSFEVHAYGKAWRIVSVRRRQSLVGFDIDLRYIPIPRLVFYRTGVVELRLKRQVSTGWRQAI